MLTVQPRLPGENNREYSYRMIRDGIMSLQLQPGQVLREVELAEMLHLSRTPVREVIAKLREEYLVDVYPQVGTFVSKIKPQLIKEASFMRYILGKEVLKLACESFPQENLLEMKKNLTLQEELFGCKGAEWEFHKLDRSFHYALYQGKKKEHVWTAITRLSTHYNRMRLLAEMGNGFKEAVVQHKIMIHMIENKESNQVERIVRQHILEPLDRWKNLLKESSPYIQYFELDNKVPAFQ